MTEEDLKPLPSPWFGPSRLAKAVADSLLNQRDRWDTNSNHIWTHRTGVSLWIANKDYGLGLSVGQNRCAEPNLGDLRAVDRRCIWRAAHRVWRDNQAVTRARAERAFGLAGTPQ